MKNYLSISIGCRGMLEGVEEIEGSVVEKYVKERWDSFVNGNGLEDFEKDEEWKKYVKEFGIFEKREWGWDLG